MPAPVSCPTAAALAKAVRDTPSLCTWSHEAASTDTGLRDVPWADLEDLPFDEDHDEDEDDDGAMLQHLSADLLHEGDGVDADVQEGSHGAEKPVMKEMIADILADKLSADVLEWMEDELMLGAPPDKDVCLDIMA
jgi:hypothetical protein